MDEWLVRWMDGCIYQCMDRFVCGSDVPASKYNAGVALNTYGGKIGCGDIEAAR